MKNQFFVTLLFSSIYAVLRYVVFGTVSLIHAPVYILNKGISMTAAVSLFMASLSLVRGEGYAARFWTRVCSHLVFVHIFLSLGIFFKAYSHHFFSGDKMNLTGEVVLLSGVLAVYCFWRRQASELMPSIWRTLTILVCILVAVHLFAMGYVDWLRVQKWNGALPPTTLLSFFLVIASLLAALWATKKRVSFSSGEGGVLYPGMDS